MAVGNRQTLSAIGLSESEIGADWLAPVRLAEVIIVREEKMQFSGKIISVQPRIRLIRSFDERSHNYLGYVLYINGIIGDKESGFSVGIGKSTQEKFGFTAGDCIEGFCLPVANPKQEPVEYYKATKLKKTERNSIDLKDEPPWEITPPSLEEYRRRGHRRLSARTYEVNCRTCIWGCRMPVEIIIDNWNPSKRQYRFETFCYGPKACNYYKAGPTRKVPGRNGMSYEEPDWVDEQEIEHRDQDE